MTNYEYIKTLSQDELLTFIMTELTMAFKDILDEAIRCLSDDEQSSTALEMWKNWLNEQHEATEQLKEEAIDVCMVLRILGCLPHHSTVENSPKWERWENRLKAGHNR